MGGTSEQAASFINSTLLASDHIPFLHISDVILTAHTPGGVVDVVPKVEIPGMGLLPTKENSRVCTVLARAGDLCFCLFASLSVVKVVLKICMRSVLEGVDVNNGNRTSRSLDNQPGTKRTIYFVGVMTPFLRRITRDWTSFSRTSGDRFACCS